MTSVSFANVFVNLPACEILHRQPAKLNAVRRKRARITNGDHAVMSQTSNGFDLPLEVLAS
jgi:hypothetical protein